MRSLSLLIILSLFTNLAGAQRARLVPFSEVEQTYDRNNDTTYIVNFFASWCVPCMQEMPELLSFAAKSKSKMQLVLVSLDFADNYWQELDHVMKKFNIKQEILVIRDADANTWMNRVDTSWSGALPATLVLNHSRSIRRFAEGKVTTNKLQKLTR
jgi:thiol-disulfide isomerase/thioredoxin